MKSQNIFLNTEPITSATFNLNAEYFLVISILYLILSFLVLKTYKNINIQKFISELASIILFLTCYLLFNEDTLYFYNSTFNDSVVNDSLGFFGKITICIFSGFYFVLISDSLKEQKIYSFEYIIVLLLAIFGLILLCSSNDLITSYLAIELTSFSSYILAAYRKDSSYSVESGIKYFIVGSVSSAFLLLGTSIIYGFCGSVNFSDIYSLFFHHSLSDQDLEKFSLTESYFYALKFLYFTESVDFTDFNSSDTKAFLDFMYLEHIFGAESWKHLIPILMEGNFPGVETTEIYSFTLIEISITIILFGMFIKLALAPFHAWSLDVYEGSPTSSTFFFAVITKLSLFIFMIRFCHFTTFSFKETWQLYSIWIAILSVLVGSFGGLRQRKIKTILAYSSISHMGYALFAFAVGSSFGLKVLLFYLFIYMITGTCTWYILTLLRLKDQKIKYSKDLGDLILLKNTNPALALCLALVLFSTAGIPPLVGFLAKLGVFLSLLDKNFSFACLIAVLCSVISTFYYIRLIKSIYFENVLVGKLYYPIKNNKPLILSFMTFLLLFLFVDPSLLFLLIDKIIFSFF
jgi:NADH:ubiquinone oxidoreductase subunit 2 (subunit N)